MMMNVCTVQLFLIMFVQIRAATDQNKGGTSCTLQRMTQSTHFHYKEPWEIQASTVLKCVRQLMPDTVSNPPHTVVLISNPPHQT